MHSFLKVPTVMIDELDETYTLIDVRSPAEFAEFHIPGAINVPVFSNEERAQVGTVYKQVGREAAKALGIQIVSPKLPEIYAQLKALHDHEGPPIVIYCWRGGMRSKSLAVTMSMMELPVRQLIGGIRSYRQQITDDFKARLDLQKPFLVLEGNTGTAKTLILERLTKEGYPVLSLEQLASHRGSAFGGIGLMNRSQKMFDSLLYERLQQLQDAPYYIIEAESKRIGNIVLPEFLLEGKENGIRIHLHAPMEFRVQTICEMYQFSKFYTDFTHGIEVLKKHMGPSLYAEVQDSFSQKNYEHCVRLMLEHYYDPRYEFAAGQYHTPLHSLHIESLEDGVQKVKQQIEHIIHHEQLLTR
ncbi:tRNA 2-selenouridine(34) synthase MnmH [Microbacteriaceae bacterium 4G12]